MSALSVTQNVSLFLKECLQHMTACWNMFYCIVNLQQKYIKDSGLRLLVISYLAAELEVCDLFL